MTANEKKYTDNQKLFFQAGLYLGLIIGVIVGFAIGLIL